MEKNTLLTTLIIILCASIIGAQSDIIFNTDFNTEFDQNLKISSDDIATTGVETIDGELAVAGFVTMGNGQTDAFLSVRPNNATDRVKFYESYGGAGNDGANAMLTLDDGTFLIIGYTEGKFNNQKIQTFGGKDGWILKIDEWGNIIKNIPIGSSGEDELTDLVSIGRGNIVAVGTKADSIWAVKFNADGDILEQFTKLPARNSYYKSNAVAFHNDTIAIVGAWSNKTKSKENGFFIPVDVNKDFGIQSPAKGLLTLPRLTEAKDILYEPGYESYYVAGNDNNNQNPEILIIEVKIKGTRKTRNPIYQSNLPNADYVSCIKADALGRIYLGGYTRSLPEASANLYNPLLLRIVRGSKSVESFFTNQIFNFNKKTIIRDLTFTYDQGIVMMGYQEKKGFDSWFFKIGQKSVDIAGDEKMALSVTGIKMLESSNNDTLDYNETGSIQFQLKVDTFQNVSSKVSARIELESPIEGFKHYSSIVLPLLREGEVYTFKIPIRGDENLWTAMTNLNVVIYDNSSRILNRSDNFVVNTKSGPFPILKFISDLDTLADEELLEREQITNRKCTIKNYGGAIANNVRVRLNYPYMVYAVGRDLIAIGPLQPGETGQINYSFRTGPFYHQNDIEYSAVLFGDDPANTDYKSTHVRLIPYTQIRLSDGSLFQPLSDPSFLREIPRPAIGDCFIELPAAKEIEWAYPKTTVDSMVRGVYEIRRKYIVLKATFESNKILHPEDVSIVHSVKGGLHIEKTGFEDQDTLYRQANNQYVYIAKVWLGKGKNIIHFEIKSINAISKAAAINYIPPNQHIIPFSFFYANPAYSTAEVSEIAELLKGHSSKSNQLYSSIHIYDYFMSSDSITPKEVEIFFRKIYTSSILGTQKIENFDHIVFIGFFHGDSRYSAGGNMPPIDLAFFVYLPAGTGKKKTINYTDAINFDKKILAPISSKKFEKNYFIINACKSGAASILSEGYDNTIKEDFKSMEKGKLIRSAIPKKTYALASSEYFENTTTGSKYGYLTSAVKEALSGKNYKVKRKGKARIKKITADGGDDILTMTELYDFCFERMSFCWPMKSKDPIINQKDDSPFCWIHQRNQVVTRVERCKDD